jgi:DNA mismatch repair ATPase MutS
MPTKVELNRKRVSNWAKNNPEKYKLLQRKSHLKRYYNITLEKYEDMFNKRNEHLEKLGARAIDSISPIREYC